MNLQKELCEARNYHINLHVEYTQLKNSYEKLVNVTEEEWQYVEKFELTEPINRVISKFWENVEFITTAFFDIQELLNRKEYFEKSILSLWKSQIQINNLEDSSKMTSEEVVPSSEEGTSIVPSYMEYLNSQLIELKGRIKWVEYNLMKYRFAASHGPELKSTIDKLLQFPKVGKWHIFSRSSPSQSKRLMQEVSWYRKKLKFFREDVQRIKSIQHAIFLKYVSPDDRKRFPPRTLTLENALKGIPSNYPGSWIETSKHSGLSMISSAVSSSSGNSPLPLTNLVEPIIGIESNSLSNTDHPNASLTEMRCIVNASGAVRSRGMSVVSHGNNSRMTSSNSENFRLESSPQNLRTSQKRTVLPIAKVAFEQRNGTGSHVNNSCHRRRSWPDAFRCQGDPNSAASKTPLVLENFSVDSGTKPPSPSDTNEKVKLACLDDADNDEHGAAIMKVSSNPFEDEVEEGIANVDNVLVEPNVSAIGDCDVISGLTRSSSRDVHNPDVIPVTSASPSHTLSTSTYESTEEVSDNGGIGQPDNIKLTRESNAHRISNQSLSVPKLGAPLPCLPPVQPSSSLYNPYPLAYNEMTSYSLFNRFAGRPEKSVLQKMTTFLHVKKKY